ncbi:MAG: aldose 1-epimerase [Cytophagaceae bacterium]
MYQVKNTSIGKYKGISLESADGSKIEILPDYGAILNAFYCRIDDNLINIIAGSKDESELSTKGKSQYRSSKLFPFPNRIKDGKYNFNGCDFNFPINHPAENNALHGFVFDRKFEIKKLITEKDFASVTLSYAYDGTYPGFPFPFELNITHKFSSNNYECKTEVSNTGNSTFPMGSGWHPYFGLGKSINELVVELPEARLAEVDHRLIPTGSYKEIKMETGVILGTRSFDSCFELKNINQPKQIVKISDPELKLNISFWQSTGEKGYNFLQVYTPPERDIIAIEPMTCLPDAFNNKVGLITLKPESKWSGTYGIKAKRI